MGEGENQGQGRQRKARPLLNLILVCPFSTTLVSNTWRCTKVVQKTKVVWNPLIKLWIEFWIELWRTLLHSLEQRESSTLPLAHFLFHTSSSTFPLPHFSSASPLLHLLFRSSFLFFIIVNILFFFLCLLLFRTPCKKIFFQTIQT